MGPLFILLCLVHAHNPLAKHNRQKRQQQKRQPARKRPVVPVHRQAIQQRVQRPAPRYQPPPQPVQPLPSAQAPQRLDIHIYVHQETPKKKKKTTVVDALPVTPTAPKPLPILPAKPRQPYNDDVYQALRALGFKPTEAKARMTTAALSGSESVEDAVRACLLVNS